MPDPSTAKPVDFVGDSGPGAVIDLYLPQPGHHVGRRIIKIEDIPENHFRDTATKTGVPWPVYLGVEKRENFTEIVRPEALVDAWFTWYSRAERLRPSAVAPVKTSLIGHARSTMALQGSLGSWGRGGVAGTARMSLKPGESTSAEPVFEITPPGPGGKGGAGADTRFESSMGRLVEGFIEIPVPGWGDLSGVAQVDIWAPPRPTLFIIQVIGISSFLGDYGLGRTVKTFTLLPGETTTIHTRTWRSSSEKLTHATSIIDSYDESAQERFIETVQNETTDAATREKTENWHAEGEAKAALGIFSANVSGGSGGEYSSSTEEFARSLDEAVREHAAEASSHRENTVSSSSESSVATEDEEVVERTIKNINVSRVLNFTFRVLNQVYDTKTHLKDIRIAFSNGNVNSWREEPISGLRRLVEEVILPEHVDKVCSDILATVAIVRNQDAEPVPVLDQVRLNPCGTDFRAREALPDDECRYPPPSADGRLYYRFRRGPLAQEGIDRPVDGVLLSENRLMLASDSVVVEALLGVNSALDGYSENLQLEAIREKQLANEQAALAQQIVRDGKDAEAGLYQRVFGACCPPGSPPVEEDET